MKRLALTILVALLALAPGAAHAQLRPLVVAAGEVAQGDIATVDQPIVVEGVVEGDVTSWSGAILIEGEVRGDVVSYVGTITLGPAAEVSGSVLAMAGAVHGDRADVAGSVLGAQPVAGRSLVAGLATILGRQPATVVATIPRPLLSGVLAAIGLAICALLAAIWPARTAGTALALRRGPGRAALLGMLTTLLLGLLLPPLASLLALSLVGMPLLPPLLVVLQLPYLFGLAALGRLLADTAGARALHPAAAAALGALPILLALAVVGIPAPMLSALLFYTVASVGLGAAILSRGGAYTIG